MRPLLLLITACLVAASHGATTVTITSKWNGGFNAEPCVPITTTINGGWKAHVIFSMKINSLEVWNSVATKLSDKEYLLENNWETLTSGSDLCFWFVARTDGEVSPDISIWIEGMDGPGTSTSGPSTTAAPTPTPGAPSGAGNGTKNYGQALTNSILFYDAQRSGKLPADNPVTWRGDSALGDCVTGGWYDAGDHVKFGLPMAASTHLLVWSLVKFKDGYVKAGQLDMMHDMIRWPLDYFLKGWQNTKFIAQVGDGDLDHNYWGRPELMTMPRPCQWIEGSTTGADIAGESAAAMAAASVAFKDKDSTFSNSLKTAAKSLYTFAKAHSGSFTGAAPFYGSSGYKDELCLAGVWLYRATGDSSYLQEAKNNAQTWAPWAMDWDDKNLPCQILLYEETNDVTYKQAIEEFFTSWSQTGGMTYTPCGLAWRATWGSNRYAANAAFAALIAAADGIQASTYRKWAAEQINYILGDNSHDGGCYSYEIGYGSKFPQKPHHAGASVTGQQLTGALVGGPGKNDYYKDVESDYIMNEVSCDYNSGFQGALAGLTSLAAAGQIPATNNKCPCNA